MKGKKKCKKWLIALAVPILIYFVWGYFGFVGMWVPGKYDKESKTYQVLWGLGPTLNKTKKETFRIEFFTPFKRQGLIDTNGRLIIPFLYKHVYYSTYNSGTYLNYFLAQNTKDKIGAIDKENNIVIPFEYDKWPFTFSGGRYIKWEKEQKVGLSDPDKMVIPAEYSLVSTVGDFPHPFLFAAKNNYCYLVFPNGQKLKKNFYPYSISSIDHQYLLTQGIPSSDIDENIWITAIDLDYKKEAPTPMYVIINKKKLVNVSYGILDLKGNEILPVDYDDISYFGKAEIYLVRKNDKVGVFDLENRIWKFPIKFEEIKYLSPDFPLTKIRKNKYENEYWIDDKGTQILSSKTKVIKVYSEWAYHYLIFSKNDKSYKMEYDDHAKVFKWHQIEKE